MSFEEKLKRFVTLYNDMEKKMAQDDLYNKEFSMLKARSLQWKNDGIYPADAGSVPINRKKNRFKDILPFEYTRVQLHMIEGIEHSDYINANYINGPMEEVEYIAAQGPLPHTVGDFWRMLWYHNIEIVIMACREVEMGKAKCEKYWTEEGEAKEYGPISVTCTKEEKLTEHVRIRDLSATCEGEVQLIRQYHYDTWPDHDKPATAEPLIEMLEKVRMYQKRKETPIVVHCSAGCGRTGTVISTDYIRTMITTKNLGSDLSIFNIVETMRKQRPAMVQTKNQYHFLYIAAADMAGTALTADKIPDKPTAPKPTFKEMSSSAGSSSKPDYINMTKKPDYMNMPNPEKDPVTQPDYTNVSQSDDPDEMYGNQETILTTDDKVKPGDHLTNDPHRRPKPAPRALSPIPVVVTRTETGPPPVVPRTETGGPPPVVPRTETGGPPPVVPRTETEKKPGPVKPDRPKAFSSKDKESQVNTYSTVDYTVLRDKGPEISAVFEDHDKTVPFSVVQDVLDTSISSVTSPNKSKNISDILMDILDDMEDPEAAGTSENFGGPGEYMMMDQDEIDTPDLPRRTEESKHLLGEPKEEPLGDALYCEPAPVWNSPSKPPKIDDNVSNSPPSQRKVVMLGPVSSVPPTSSTTPSKPSNKSNILSLFRNKGGQTASTRHKKITPAEISAPVGPLSKGPPPEGLAGLGNRPPVQITSPMSGRAPGIVLSNPGSSTSPHNTLGRTPAGGANSKYNFPGELGFGKRVQKPKGPRKEPDSWSHWKFAS